MTDPVLDLRDLTVALPAVSTGRAPIAHPPGKETTACPSRASIGPRTRIEARIFRTMS